MLLVALLAILLPLFLIAILRLPARVGMSISALAVALAAFFIWGMSAAVIGASTLQGIRRALTILLILFGAIMLLKTMQETGALMRIKFGFHAISADMRIQAILVAFVFVSLLEGASGFGTPAIIAAPLLMVLGFKPLAAAALALLGDTVAVTFGAVGTPLIVGLENVPNYSDNLTWLVGAQVASFDLIIGTLIPLLIVSVLVVSFSGQSPRAKFRSVIEMVPWSLLIGTTYAISAFFTVRLIGPEFTAIIAAAITLTIGMLTAKWRIGVPKNIWRHHANPDESAAVTPDKYEHMPLIKAWLPYGIVIGLLLLTRIVPSVREFATNAIDAGWRNILGFPEISSNWAILYSPGTILLIAALAAAIIGVGSLRPLQNAAKSSFKTAASAMAALVPTLILVQIFTNSGINSNDLAAMPVFIGQALADVFGGLWVACAPLLGAIGAFIAGSATVSTLTMGPVQASIAASAELPLIAILALQMIGAAPGNIIAIHNVVAASTVVGLVHREELIIRRLIFPTIVYIALAAIIGLVFVKLF